MNILTFSSHILNFEFRWSHGEMVRLGDLKAWRDADFSTLTEGSQTLCKCEDGVWRRGKIESIVGELLYNH